jgi:hypothetical protein
MNEAIHDAHQQACGERDQDGQPDGPAVQHVEDGNDHG